MADKREEDEEITIEMDPESAEKLKQYAMERGITPEEAIVEILKAELKSILEREAQLKQRTGRVGYKPVGKVFNLNLPPKDGGLKHEAQIPGETIEEYFNRAIASAKSKNRSLVITIGMVYVDVTPETTYDYLLGYLDGFRSHI